MKVIDLNCDVGEGPGEEPLYAFMTSANIACGGHAGDAATMEAALRLALRHGVAAGAHPSYPDRANFGRVALPMPEQAIEDSVREQVSALLAIATRAECALRHVKPHGALYNLAAKDTRIAEAIARGVAAASPGLILVGLAGSRMLDVWRGQGHAVAAEGFADRAYEPDGTLRQRSLPGALVTDPAAAAEQAVRLAREGRVRTICVHSDTPRAAAVIEAARRALEREGFSLRSL